MALTDATRAQASDIIARYPESRSALLPLLHLIQAEEGSVTSDGIAFCAQALDLTEAEVASVATFYTMYKRHRTGRHHIGVCTNTLCAVLGGDAVWASVSEELGIGHDETTADGEFSIERIECQAACSHAPSVTINWEFFDDATPSSVSDAIAKLRAGQAVQSTRGPQIRDFRATEATLATLDDGLAGEGPSADRRMLAGLTAAKERGFESPDGKPAPARPTEPAAEGEK